MTLVLTQSDFRANLTKYLDQANDEEIVQPVRSNSRAVSVLSQEKLYWMENALQSNVAQLEQARASIQVIQRHMLPHEPIVQLTDNYMNKVK